MTKAIAYLAFDGNCAEAFRTYERVLKGKLEVLMSGGDSPMKDQMPKEFHDAIIHARLALPGGGTIYGGDAPKHIPYQGIHGVSITLDFDTVAEATRVFNALADGGTISMPLQPAFWAKCWGMCTDKFGCPWIINGEEIPV